MKKEKEIIKEFEEKFTIQYADGGEEFPVYSSDIPEEAKCCHSPKEIKDFISKVLDQQKKEILAKNRKDLEFIKEMYECSQKLLNEKYDITVLEHLDKMIEDWKDELEQLFK